jgi:TonB family protein
MSLSDLAIGSAALHLLGWSLLHFLWQGALVALLLGAVLLTARNWTVQSRYALCCAALALMALCPFVTFVYMAHASGGAPSASLLVASADHGAQLWQSTPAPLLERAAAIADRAMPWILVVWIAGVLFLLTRAIGASITVSRLKTASIVPAPESLLAMAMNMADRLGITQGFKVFVSTAATAPTVIGWLKPVILFPVASLAGLAPEQLEAMLAHELAHIRRRDYLVNALQVVMETLLFYHPAVWWVSRQIRHEREHCCDDVAVAVTGSPFVYAKALFLLEEQRATAPQLTLGGNGGQLSMRIRRLLAGKQSTVGTYGAAGWMLTVMLLVLTGGLVASAVTIGKARAQSTAPVSYTQRTATGQDAPESDPRLKLLEGTDPTYPAKARAAHVSGEVQVAIVVSPKGEVTEAHVVSGDPMLRQAALDAVRKYKFAPFAEDKDKAAKATVVVNFVLYGEVRKDDAKPDLLCTYYDNQNATYLGTCERNETNAEQYNCRRNDAGQQVQHQSACEWKVKAFEAWEARQKDNP